MGRSMARRVFVLGLRDLVRGCLVREQSILPLGLKEEGEY